LRGGVVDVDGVAAAAACARRSEVAVRINGLDTPWGADDLKAVAGLVGVHAIALPKVESPDVVRHVAARVADTQSLFCMLETPRGILAADVVAGASPKVSALVMGTSDLTNELRAQHTPDRMPLWFSLAACVLAARAHGLMALDGVHLTIRDTAEFDRHCLQGRAMGFDGKTLIHPDTIAPANRHFGPTGEEIDIARRTLAAFAEATREGRGVAVLDGRLIENLHVDAAQRTLALADALR
jgi:citrate lyase subunit beta/citryl-CoA lyase